MGSDMRGWGREPEWMHDMRQLEVKVAEALERDGVPRERREGQRTNVQTGFRTFIAGPNELAITWRAAYNHVVPPNEAREKRYAMRDALAAAGFAVKTSAGSSEVRVRRDLNR